MFTRASHRSIVLPTCFALLALGRAAIAGDVLVVSPTGPFTQIQAAIDAASDLDTILVKPHPGFWDGYGAFVVNGKSLAIIGETNTSAIVRVRGEMRIDGMAGGSLVVLGNIEATQTLGAGGTGGNALRTIQNDGAIRIEKCSLIGTLGGVTSTELYRCTWIGMDSDTQFVSSDVVGAQGPAGETGAWSGGVGLYSTAPTLRILDCALVGGHGGNSISGDSDVGVPDGGNGGDALRASDGRVFANGCAMSGGHGGAGDFVFCPEWGPGANGGIGGNGLRVGETSAPNGITAHFFSQACPVDGGEGGAAGGGGCPPGTDGAPGVAVRVQDSGAYHPLVNTVARLLTGTPLARENASVVLTAHGAQGDRVYARVEVVPRFPPAPAPPAPLRSTLERMQKPGGVFLGTIPASGTLSATIPVGSLPSGVETSWWRLHSNFLLTSGVVVEGNDFVVAIVDSSF